MPNQSRQSFITLVRLVTFLACTIGLNTAQSAAPYPSERPIQMVVPYPAGGGSDIIARIVATPLSKAIGQTVIVENIGGATGMIGAKKVLNSAPDGYTILQGSANDIILTPLLNKSAGYKPNDFKLIQPVTRSIIVLLAKTSLPIESIDDFIELSRRSKDAPLSYGTVGTGSQYHLMGEKLAEQTKGHVLHVPYKGAAPVIQDIAGGQLDFAILPYQPSMKEMAKQKRMKLIVAFSKSQDLPAELQEFQSIEKSKIAPHFIYSVGSGYYARKDMPDATVQKIRDALGVVLQEQDVRKRLEESGRSVLSPMSAKEVRKFEDNEFKSYNDMVKPGFALQ